MGGQIGLCLQAVAVAFGIGALAELLLTLWTAVIKLAGAGYLVFAHEPASAPVGRRGIEHGHQQAVVADRP